MYTKANDWGDEIGRESVASHSWAVTNEEKTQKECRERAPFSVNPIGLGFSLANNEVFYVDEKEKPQVSKYVRYDVKVDGSFELRDNDEDFAVGNLDNKPNGLEIPTGFADFKIATKFGNKVLAVSAPSTGTITQNNVGAIAFYKWKNNGWKLKDEVFGESDNMQLGLYILDLETEHALKAVSNNYRTDYFSDQLVS